MQTVVPHSEIARVMKEQNDERESQNLPPIESFIPSDDMVNLVNELITDDRGREGMAAIALAEVLEQTQTNDNDEEHADDAHRMATYISFIPPSLNVKNVAISERGLEVRWGLPD